MPENRQTTSDPKELCSRLRASGAKDLAQRVETGAANYVCPGCGGKNAGVGLTQEPYNNFIYFCLDCSPGWMRLQGMEEEENA